MALHPLALLDPAESRLMDEVADQNGTLADAMERAGWAVAMAIRTRSKPCRVVVVCGAGNNGGDGYVAARWLALWGWSVSVLAIWPPREGSLAEKAAQAWCGPIYVEDEGRVVAADLVVDAVLGAGLSRLVAPEILELLHSARRVVAIDVPSGVCGATGRLLGAVRAVDFSVCFVRPRPAHFLQPSASFCGEVVCADIGMTSVCEDAVRSQVFLNEPGLWFLPRAGSGDHKYRRGVVSICGGLHMTGATRLSAQAARSAGAGLVRILGGDLAVYRNGEPGLIVDACSLGEALVDQRRRVWLCGVGLCEDEVSTTLPVLLRAGRSVVADAGAFGEGANRLNDLRGVTVITPHEGEFKRLFGNLLEKTRIVAVREAAQNLGAIVVLKGSDTLIAAPDGRVAINAHASPALATAGSGDTLSGIIAALLAAGMDAWEASCAAVWMHGEAGKKAGDAYGRWPVVEVLAGYLGGARAEAEKRQNAINCKNFPFARL
ncbi:NAD(P)H-hydrate dehydratase [Neokomagataea anthophila]|uniref:Bifunctional NAD(P)H-hydrate repair enzyme n=1 Tax=Neokomagataea anthophila TaxID=2826925 RepID=A0ABS5E6P2_9PROT|nr:NAD(P)H-hydrate dehydratase [Neokomagataea anthophila]MBR0559471.1 NAD(P)H-hydrate dehydratase [Neokomagataea anthophila]